MLDGYGSRPRRKRAPTALRNGFRVSTTGLQDLVGPKVASVCLHDGDVVLADLHEILAVAANLASFRDSGPRVCQGQLVLSGHILDKSPPQPNLHSAPRVALSSDSRLLIAFAGLVKEPEQQQQKPTLLVEEPGEYGLAGRPRPNADATRGT